MEEMDEGWTEDSHFVHGWGNAYMFAGVSARMQ